MVTYSTNWMGPVSTQWYEDRNIPFEMRETSGKLLPKVEYKHFLESYSCGRIDIYGLDYDKYYAGRDEYGLAPMKTNDWNYLSDWLNNLETEQKLGYTSLLQQFEEYLGRDIQWFDEPEPKTWLDRKANLL